MRWESWGSSTARASAKEGIRSFVERRAAVFQGR